MSYKHVLLAASALLVVAGCAHRFPTAEPLDVPNAVYAGQTCEQLAVRKGQLLTQLKEQKDQMPGEALPSPKGRFKALVTLDNTEETLFTKAGRTKGHINAVQAAMTAQGCEPS